MHSLQLDTRGYQMQICYDCTSDRLSEQVFRNLYKVKSVFQSRHQEQKTIATQHLTQVDRLIYHRQDAMDMYGHTAWRYTDSI